MKAMRAMRKRMSEPIQGPSLFYDAKKTCIPTDSMRTYIHKGGLNDLNDSKPSFV